MLAQRWGNKHQLGGHAPSLSEARTARRRKCSSQSGAWLSEEYKNLYHLQLCHLVYSFQPGLEIIPWSTVFRHNSQCKKKKRKKQNNPLQNLSILSNILLNYSQHSCTKACRTNKTKHKQSMLNVYQAKKNKNICFFKLCGGSMLIKSRRGG